MELGSRFGLCQANLALTSFVACQHPAESCGHNGLPLTPNSIAILGQAEVLKSLEHDNLCSYLDFQRGQHDRIVCVSEFYQRNLRDFTFSHADLMNVAAKILSVGFFFLMLSLIANGLFVCHRHCITSMKKALWCLT